VCLFSYLSSAELSRFHSQAQLHGCSTYSTKTITSTPQTAEPHIEHNINVYVFHHFIKWLQFIFIYIIMQLVLVYRHQWHKTVLVMWIKSLTKNVKLHHLATTINNKILLHHHLELKHQMIQIFFERWENIKLALSCQTVCKWINVKRRQRDKGKLLMLPLDILTTIATYAHHC